MTKDNHILSYHLLFFSFSTSDLHLPTNSEKPSFSPESHTLKEQISYTVHSEALIDSIFDLNLSLLKDAAEMHPEAGANPLDIYILYLVSSPF